MPKVSLGVPAGTRGLSLLQLLGDRIELQGPDDKDLAGPQELFSFFKELLGQCCSDAIYFLEKTKPS